MNASDALELSNQNWIDNEDKLLKLVIGWQNKVETAAKEGRTRCVVCTFDPQYVDFVSYYFEKMGYFVMFQSISASECVCMVDWHVFPQNSRHFIDNQKFLSAILT